MYLQDTLFPIVIQWLLDTLLVVYCIGKYDSKINKKCLEIN